MKKSTPSAATVRDATLQLLDGAIATLSSRRDDKGVHAARKATKRIRAALRLLRSCLGPRVYRRENRRVRDAAKPLSALRDDFVLRRTLENLPRRQPALQGQLNSDYRRDRESLLHGGAEAAKVRLAATREQLRKLPLDGPQGASAIDGVRRIYKAGRKALSRARSREDEALHEWRKQAKYLLNQLELLRDVFHAKFKKLQRRVERLAEILGDDHDLAVLRSKLPNDRTRHRTLVKRIEKRRRKLQAKALSIGRKLYRRSAKRTGALVAARLAAG